MINYSKHVFISLASFFRKEWLYRLEYIENLETLNITSKIFLKYTIDNLKPNTRYEIVVKTYASFNSDTHNEAQSDITYFETMIDYPNPIRWVKTKNKTTNSLTIEWSNAESSDVRSYVHIQLFEQRFNKSKIESRNYCRHRMNRGSRVYSENPIEGCCGKMIEETRNRKFEEDITKLFECSLDNPNNCDLKDNHKNILVEENVPSTENHATFHNLRFAIYIFKIFACNDIGCSNYYYHSDITLYDIAKDALQSKDVIACRKDNQYEIQLPTPKDSEGIITSFVLSFFDNLNEVEKPIRLCVTEKKHKQLKYHLTTNFENVSRIFEELQIETFSLSGSFHDNKFITIADCGGLGDSVLISFMALAIVVVILGCYIFRKRIQSYMFMIWLRYKPQRQVDEEILMEEFETINFSVY